jgi:hypothetical protein
LIVLLAVLILFLGAVCVLFLNPERRFLRLAAFLAPVLALISLLLPIPLPSTFQISWQPDSLFPDPLSFNASPVAVSFAVSFCVLLILLEWTRPFQTGSTRTARVLSFLLVIGGMIACASPTPLATALLWGWIDFLSFLSILLLSRSAVIGPRGISSSVSRSVGLLSMNFLGTALILIPVLTTPASAWATWTTVWSAQTSGPAVVLFLAGVGLRLVILPLQLSFAQRYTSSTRVDIILRLLTPAIVLSFLAQSWPAAALLPVGGPQVFWLSVFVAGLTLWCGLQWWFSISPFGRRDLFVLAVPSLAILSALQGGSASGVFHAAGLAVILGGGIILLYHGFIPGRRWLAAIPLFLFLLQCGLPDTPMHQLIAGFLSGSVPAVYILAGLGQIFLLSALLRMAFEPTEEFPPVKGPAVWIFGLTMLLAAVFLLFPIMTAKEPVAVTTLLFIAVSVAASIGLSFLARRFQRAGENLLHFLEGTFRLEWLRWLTGFLAGRVLFFGGLVENLFSGEGAMLWAFGLAILLLIILRGI